MDLIVFDFDGTLTQKDTLLEIAKFSTSTTFYWLKFLTLSPHIVLMKLKLISNQTGKEVFLKRFFGNYSKDEFNDLATRFANERVPQLIRPKGLELIKELNRGENRLAIVSASPENWIKPWADKYDIEVIATKLKFENNRLVGIEGKNCNGEEKVRRIKEVIDLKDYDKVIAYGDTKGDLPMLALADEKHYKPFR